MASDQWLIASEFDRLSALAEGLLLYSREESGASDQWPVRAPSAASLAG